MLLTGFTLQKWGKGWPGEEYIDKNIQNFLLLRNWNLLNLMELTAYAFDKKAVYALPWHQILYNI